MQNPLLLLFSSLDHSSDTIYRQAHPEIQVPQVLPYGDSDSDNEFTYMHAESVTEEIGSNSDSSDTPRLSDNSIEDMEFPTLVVQSKVHILPFCIDIVVCTPKQISQA